MRRLLAFVVAALVHAIGLGGVVHASLATELPEPWRRPGCILIDPPPYFHAGVLLQGASESEARAFFGQTPRARSDVRADAKCLRFEYAGQSAALTLLLKEGAVNESWFGVGRPRKCLGRTGGTIRIQPFPKRQEGRRWGSSR
jgi:hypothetical protein